MPPESTPGTRQQTGGQATNGPQEGTPPTATPAETAVTHSPEKTPSAPATPTPVSDPFLRLSIPRLQDSLHLLTVLLSLGLVVILFNTFLLLRRQRSRKEESPAEELVSTATAAEPAGEEVRRTQVADSPVADLAPPPALPKEPAPAAARPASDEFTALPHGVIGRTLSELHRAVPDLARKIPDPRQQDRFLAELDGPLKSRIERFKIAAREGDAYLAEHWIEQDLVTTLNSLAQLLSSVIEERYRGRRGNRLLEEELLRWLYERLAPVCREEGWFTVEPVLPYTTKFDPAIHHSVGSVPLDGADNLVVSIKAIGRREPRQSYITHKAEVIVGR